jgi:hypothetical protein
MTLGLAFVIQKGHIFIKRVNDCPIMNVDMLEQWSKEFEQSNASPNHLNKCPIKLASALLRLPSVVPKHSSRQYSLSRRVSYLLSE